METEEIEKAADEFCLKRRLDSLDSRGYPPKVWFKAGAEFADKHWQEKTKYKSLSEELPQEGEPVILKFTENVQKVYCRLGCVALGFILLDDGDSLSQREAKELGALWRKLE